MSPAQAWKILGLKPTGDRRAVRTAYAAKLKAIDPDADIAGFQRLREARMLAERLAQYQVQADEPVDVDEPDASPRANKAKILTVVATPIFGFAERAAEPPPPPALPTGRKAKSLQLDAPAPTPAPPVDPLIEQRRRFASLLARSHWSEAKEAELKALFEAMLADPRFEQVAFAEEQEDWLAQQLLRAIPRSDSLIPQAVVRFGWARELESVRPRYAPAAIARREGDLRCIGRLSQPDHKWHAAFVRLQEPAPEKIELKERLRLGPDLGALLYSVRFHNPDVEYMFDPEHVRAWDSALAKVGSSEAELFKTDGISWFGWLVIVCLGLLVIRLVFPPAPFDPLERPDLSARPVPEIMSGSQLTGPAPAGAVLSPVPRSMPIPTSLGTPAPQQEVLPRSIQECVDAGGNLRITLTHFYCTPLARVAPSPSRPSADSAPTPPFIPAPRVTAAAPLPATDAVHRPIDPAAVAKAMAKKLAECANGGGATNSAECDRPRNPPDTVP